MKQSQEINELAAALSIAQGVIEGAKKDSKNPFFKSNYSDMASCVEAARKPLSDNGLSVSQMIEDSKVPQHITVVTTLMHKSGQWIRSKASFPCVKTDPQSYGSSTTYGRRYSFMAIINMAPIDDDGETAMQSFREKAKAVPVAEPITLEQRKFIFAKMSASKCPEDIFKGYLNTTYGIGSSKDIKKNMVDNIVLFFETYAKQQAVKGE